MGKRAASMAAIDAALTPASDTKMQNAAPTEQSVAAPHAAPGVPAITPLTANQKRGYDVARQQQIDVENQQEKIGQQEQANKDAFSRSAQATTDAISNIGKSASVKIESIPTPGDIVLPLVILFAFFLLLIPINGHTRLAWIWLTVTGNAEIVGGSNAGSGLTPATTTSTEATAATQSSMFSIPFVSQMTGVEDL